jgi:hypothetical protein
MLWQDFDLETGLIFDSRPGFRLGTVLSGQSMAKEFVGRQLVAGHAEHFRKEKVGRPKPGDGVARRRDTHPGLEVAAAQVLLGQRGEQLRMERSAVELKNQIAN